MLAPWKKSYDQPRQHIRASLVAQLVKYLPAVQEIQVQSLGWEEPLEEGMQPSPGFLPGESHTQRSLVGYSPWGHKELYTTEDVQMTPLIWQKVKKN